MLDVRCVYIPSEVIQGMKVLASQVTFSSSLFKGQDKNRTYVSNNHKLSNYFSTAGLKTCSPWEQTAGTNLPLCTELSKATVASFWVTAIKQNKREKFMLSYQIMFMLFVISLIRKFQNMPLYLGNQIPFLKLFF